MKKRLVSLALALCLAVTLFAGLAPAASAAAPANNDRRVGFLVSYTFQAGDTIYGLCEKYKLEFATNYLKIGKINNITNFNYMMPGRVIWIPSQTATTGTAYYTLLSHTLLAGETPAGLCQSYGIDYNTNYNLLAALNTNMTTFMAGQEFILPLYVAPAQGAQGGSTGVTGSESPAAGTATPAPPVGTGTATATGVNGDTLSFYLAQHVLQGGETVSGICAALGVNFMEMADMIQGINEIASFNYMLPGKTLLIPVKTLPTSGSYYKVMAHTVAAGDTVYDLCMKYGLAFDAYSNMIAKLNGRDNLASFYVGETLYMPMYVAAPSAPVTPVSPAASAGTAAGTQATPAPAGSTQTQTQKPTDTGAPANVPQGDTLEYLVVSHVLQSGETVISVCDGLKVDFWNNQDRIKQLSNIAYFEYLFPGKEILIPSYTYPASGAYYKIYKHTFVAGDTVYDLCLKYGLNYNTNIAFVQRLNNRTDLTGYMVGDTILMPLYVSAGGTAGGTVAGGTTTGGTAAGGTAAGTTTDATAIPIGTAKDAEGVQAGITYDLGASEQFILAYRELKAGEYVTTLCVELGVSFEENAQAIATYSGITDWNYLRVGQGVFIPVPKFPETGTVAVVYKYTLREGDSIFKLSTIFGFNVNNQGAFVQRLNGNRTLDSFHVGETILLPHFSYGP